MRNDEYMKYIPIGIACSIFLIIFEFFLFQKPVNEEEVKASETVKQEVETYARTTVKTDTEKVYIFINGIVGLMNERDYETLYSLLRDDYKEYEFSEYENFKNYMDVYLKEKEYVPKYGAYTRNNSNYIVVVNFMKKEYTREDLLKNTPLKTDIITLVKDDKTGFKFSMSNFIESKVCTSTVTSGDLEISMLRATKYADETEAKFMLTNNSKDTVYYLETKNVTANVEGGNTGITSTIPLTAVKPGERVVFNVKFYLKYNSDNIFSSLIFNGIVDSKGNKLGQMILKAK